MADKWLCDECKWCGPDSAILRAPNPFSDDETDTMVGCPECREPNTMTRACDEAGCEQQAGMGTPTANRGYVWSCFKHRPVSVNQ
jgi:hypothetical protein